MIIRATHIDGKENWSEFFFARTCYIFKHSGSNWSDELKCASNWLDCTIHLSPPIFCYGKIRVKIWAQQKLIKLKSNSKNSMQTAKAKKKPKNDPIHYVKLIIISVSPILSIQILVMSAHVLADHERMTEWELVLEYIMCAHLCIRCMSTVCMHAC